jgi:rod shape-determining protein MreC
MPGARRASRRRYVLLVIVLTCLTLITLDTRNGRTGPVGALGRVAHRIVSPVQKGVDNVASPISDWWDGVTNSGHLKRDNRRLQDEVAALQGNQTLYNEAIRENTDLKKLVKLQQELLVKNVTGLIIGRGAGNFDPTLTIDTGTEAGIAVDMPVISPEGIVGKVIEVWHGGAMVQVLTDPDFSVGVQTPGHGAAPATTGIATGQNGSHDLSVEFDPGSDVRRGDEIVTSPQSTLFPAGLAVGTIASVAAQPGNTGINATITPYVHLGALQHLMVLLWTAGTPGPVIATTTTTAPATTTTTTTTTVPGQTSTSSPGTSTTTKPGG